MEPRFPHTEFTIDITSPDGNAMFIVGKAKMWLKQLKVPKEEIKQFSDNCFSGDYENLLDECRKWFDCDFYGNDE